MELKLIPQSLANIRETFGEGVGYAEMCGVRFPRASVVLDSALFLSRVSVCAVVGHKLVDNGYAGPDSGCIDIECARCGWSFGRTVLY